MYQLSLYFQERDRDPSRGICDAKGHVTISAPTFPKAALQRLYVPSLKPNLNSTRALTCYAGRGGRASVVMPILVQLPDCLRFRPQLVNSPGKLEPEAAYAG
jgi:hypothetical protein